MVHADAAALPSYVETKSDFYDHLESSLLSLIDPGTDWISSLSNASSLIYNSMNRFPEWKEKRVNWAGFYLLSPLLPSELLSRKHRRNPTLLLGPFNGLPACQLIWSLPGKGVCADASALLPPRVVRVDDTHAYPGHIACDSLSKSEIVVPLVINRQKLPKIHQQALQQQSPQTASAPENNNQTVEGQDRSWAGRGNTDHIIIGVLDIDCESFNGFDQQDEQRLFKIANLIVERSAW
ncbi:related to methionine-R-sulfoxide reductase [Ustilago trichophora]|uniref:Related to methionine-R-sulfoxide reductase n=1 Tax=Ustilago trichophora TaxID=86804 RepID=A0A5C3EL32_9BASI|nr:related to methionine-R-sulfoxide reductase [Ustilago trichophora]